MPRTGQPKTATIKRLFALSNNCCAFPKCTAGLVVESVVTGEVCHIKAASPDGPRYDPSQSDEERHAFDNLLLMCPAHHKVIDDDEEAYSVDRLHALKQRHEAGEHPESAPEVAELFAAAVLGSSVFGNVTNVGQVTVHHNPPPAAVKRPQLQIGFASDMMMPLQSATTLMPLTNTPSGMYLRSRENISIRTENQGSSLSARNLSWSYTFPAGVAVWSGPGYDGMLHYLDSRWRYKPTQIHVNAEWLNPDSGVIHPFNIELPTDGRLQVPIEVAVAMTDAPVTRAVLAAHIPDFVAEALARKFQEDLEEASKRSER
ncbi:MAG: hypothetical protein JOZ81_31905 [Chloroflexi bacterium]|nr:hypothetical protein [Chloroflexota bacterium]